MKVLRFRKKKISANDRKGGWRKTLKSPFLIAGAVALFAGVAVVLSLRLYGALAGLFPVTEVVFSGNTHLSDAELKAMGGITRSDSLLTFSARSFSGKLLQSPWIREVSIRKEFPHRILVRVAETSPFAILEVKGRTFLIDDRGRMLEEMKGTVPFLPIINADPFKDRENFLEALSLAKVIKDRKIATERNRVEIIADKGQENISMVLDNVVVKVGYGDYEQKLERLFSLEDEIRKRAITVDYVDLRFANRVVVKPISEVVR